MGVTPDTPATPKIYSILYKKIKHTIFIKKNIICKMCVCVFLLLYIYYMFRKKGVSG